MFTTMKSRVLSGSALLAAVAIALGVTIAPVHSDDDTNGETTKRIGTYDPEMVFQQYHGLQELIALSQRLEGEAQQAQMEGNQQRLQELQMEMQEGQMRIINQFHQDVQRVMPELADRHELDIVAVEVIYASNEYGDPEDISQQLAERLAEDAPETDEIPPAEDPFAPGPQ